MKIIQSDQNENKEEAEWEWLWDINESHLKWCSKMLLISVGELWQKKSK